MSSFQTTLTRKATYIAAGTHEPKDVLNSAGAVVFHKTTADVSPEDASLDVGQTLRLTEGRYFISKAQSEVFVREVLPEEQAATPKPPKPPKKRKRKPSRAPAKTAKSPKRATPKPKKKRARKKLK